MMKRTYQPDVIGGVAANFYPHVFAAYIADEEAQLTAYGQQPHGVASTQPGELQLMMHRRTAYGGCGLNQALNDTTVLHDRMLLTFDDRATSARMQSRITAGLNGCVFPG